MKIIVNSNMSQLDLLIRTIFENYSGKPLSDDFYKAVLLCDDSYVLFNLEDHFKKKYSYNSPFTTEMERIQFFFDRTYMRNYHYTWLSSNGTRLISSETSLIKKVGEFKYEITLNDEFVKNFETAIGMSETLKQLVSNNLFKDDLPLCNRYDSEFLKIRFVLQDGMNDEQIDDIMKSLVIYNARYRSEPKDLNELVWGIADLHTKKDNTEKYNTTVSLRKLYEISRRCN